MIEMGVAKAATSVSLAQAFRWTPGAARDIERCPAPSACSAYRAASDRAAFARYVLEKIPDLQWIGVDIYLEDRQVNGEHSETGYNDALERLRPFSSRNPVVRRMRWRVDHIVPFTPSSASPGLAPHSSA